MNSSLATADRATHLKIVCVALLAGILLALIGINAHGTGDNVSSASPRLEMRNPNPSVPEVGPPSRSKAGVA